MSQSAETSALDTGKRPWIGLVIQPVVIILALLAIVVWLSNANLSDTERVTLAPKDLLDMTFQHLGLTVAAAVVVLILAIPWSLACTLVGYKTVLRLDWSQTLLGYAPVFLLEMFLLLQVMQML